MPKFAPMEILVVAATNFEIAPFIKAKLKSNILITGVGVPATLYHLQKILSAKKYDLVIQAGIAGSFTKNIQLGETVLAGSDCFADIGMQGKGKFTPIFKSGFVKPNEFPYTKGWLVNKGLSGKNKAFSVVKAVTVNTISDSKAQQKMLIETYGAEIESMEGAAFHYVCLQEEIDFLQLRSISNKVGVRDKSKWQMKEAIDNLNVALAQLVVDQHY